MESSLSVKGFEGLLYNVNEVSGKLSLKALFKNS